MMNAACCPVCLELEILGRCAPSSRRYRGHLEALPETGGRWQGLRHAVEIRRGNHTALCGYVIAKRER